MASMAETEIEKLTRRARLKVMWQISAMYTKPIPILEEQVKILDRIITRLALETAILQQFIEDNQLEIVMESTRSSTDGSSSETSQSTSRDSPISATAQILMATTAKRSKRGEIGLDLKYYMAKNYLRWLANDTVKKKRQATAYVNDLLASIENQYLTQTKVQNDINWLLSKVKPAICFANKRPGDVVYHDRMSTEKWWTLVCANDKYRNRLIRATELENISVLQQIKKFVMKKKYEDQVNPAEFYRKVLENRSFPKEIAQLTNKRVKLASGTGVAEHEAYNLRRYLEKRVAHGEYLRESIAREKFMMSRVEEILAFTAATRDREQVVKKKLVKLLIDYQVPGVPEYIMLCRRNESLKSVVKMWQKKVEVANLIKNNNQQKWKQLVKNSCVGIKTKKTEDEKHCTDFFDREPIIFGIYKM